MPRKTFADSIGGQLKAIRDIHRPVEPPERLPEKLIPLWNEIIALKARDEWKPGQLRVAFELVEVMARWRLEMGVLKGEPMVDSKGRINPRLTAMSRLARLALELQRHLAIHPRMEVPVPVIAAGKRRAEGEALLSAAVISQVQQERGNGLLAEH